MCFTTQAFGTRVMRHVEDLLPSLGDVGAYIDEPAQTSTGHMVKALVDPFACDAMRRTNALSASNGGNFCGGSAPVCR